MPHHPAQQTSRSVTRNFPRRQIAHPAPVPVRIIFGLHPRSWHEDAGRLKGGEMTSPGEFFLWKQFVDGGMQGPPAGVSRMNGTRENFFFGILFSSERSCPGCGVGAIEKSFRTGDMRFLGAAFAWVGLHFHGSWCLCGEFFRNTRRLWYKMRFFFDGYVSYVRNKCFSAGIYKTPLRTWRKSIKKCVNMFFIAYIFLYVWDWIFFSLIGL